MRRLSWLVAAAVFAFLAALAGVGVGRMIWHAPPEPGVELHDLVHDELHLDAAQTARLEALETHYAEQRRTLEARMRADNARLAQAIRIEHGYGPQVAAAVNSSHVAMGELQKATLAHIFAMRQLLHADQTARFDKAVAYSLTDASQ